MKKYLLLRDNKQSGPYTIEELRTKALKPYDLVWLDGKSAAWRYPGEIEELKSFAPPVEEQPFDRFYKKPSQNNQADSHQNIQADSHQNIQADSHQNIQADILQNSQTGTLQGTLAARLSQAQPVQEKEMESVSVPVIAAQMASPVVGVQAASSLTTAQASSPVSNRKIIYVTMPAPASKTVNATRETSSNSRETTYRDSAGESPRPLQNPVMFRDKPAQQSPERSTGHVQSAGTDHLQASSMAEEKFTQREEGLWRTTVEKPPRDNKQRFSGLIQPLAAIICILALVGAGIFIGLSINRDSLGFRPEFIAKTQSGSSPHLPANPAAVPVSPSKGSAPSTIVPGQSNSNSGINSAASTPVSAYGDIQGSDARTTVAAATIPGEAIKPHKKIIAAKEKPTHSMQKVPAGSAAGDSASTAVPPVQMVTREATHRTDEILSKATPRNILPTLVSTTASKYTVGTFGGISGLQLTVSNRSAYPLDLVVVEIQYIQANKKVFKTENLYFRGIGPGSALMQEAPKSTRGIKVQYKITLINSKESGMSYTAS